ncbi:unnamed protein product, partial [Polarella glacialis]
MPNACEMEVEGTRHEVLPAMALVEQMRLVHELHGTRREQERQFYLNNKSNFNLSNDTSKLLLCACDKLLADRAAIEDKSFEEHSAELEVVCRRLHANLLTGLSSVAHDAKLLALRGQMERSGSRGSRGSRGNVRSSLCFCGSSVFPPQKDWWLKAAQWLTPVYEVYRDGQVISEIESRIVPADILYLRQGLRAPCDVRVVVCSQESSVGVPWSLAESCFVRQCSPKCTSPALLESSNMVFKGSWVLSGSLLGVVVRTAANPLVQDVVQSWSLKSSHLQQDEESVLDKTVPNGLSFSVCKNLFTALSVRASCVCRSFEVMRRLARVRSLVVIVSEENLGKGCSAAQTLAAAAKHLGQALFLVGCRNLPPSMLDELQKVSGLKLFDAAGWSQAGSVATASTAASSVGSLTFMARGASADPMIGEEIMTRFPPSNVLVETDRLVSLAENAVMSGGGGAVIGNVSEVGLSSLCRALRNAGMPPLYAVGEFHYP